MKKLILLFVMLFSVVSLFAQEAVVELDPSFNALYSFLIPAIGASIFALWTDTWKHIKAGTWDALIFAKTKLLPLGLTVAVAVAVYYMLIYTPYLIQFAEVLAGEDLLEVTAIGIFGFASRIVDDAMKTKKTVEE